MYSRVVTKSALLSVLGLRLEPLGLASTCFSYLLFQIFFFCFLSFVFCFVPFVCKFLFFKHVSLVLAIMELAV